MSDVAPAPLVGLDDVAAVLGLPPENARAYLEGKGDPPVATYKGMPLWLADTAHDLLGEVQP